MGGLHIMGGPRGLATSCQVLTYRAGNSPTRAAPGPPPRRTSFLGQVRSGQVRSGQVRSGQVRSGQVRSGQVSYSAKI